MSDATIPLEDEFGDIVAKARFGLKRTLAQVADAAGLTEETIRSLENYERAPTDAECRAIARAVGLNGDRLLAIANEAYRPRDETQEDDAQVIRLKNYVGGMSVFSYLLVCRATGDVAAVDTAAHPDQILTTVQMKNLTPRLILITHTHADHIEGVDKVQKRWGVPVVMGEGTPAPAGVGACRHLPDGAEATLGRLRVVLRKTPGHTPYCVTFVAGNVALSGDLMFAGSLGRANHSYDAIRASVRDTLFALPDATRIYPGHGPSTTVGEEKANNPFF